MENLKVLVVDSSETFGLLLSSVLDNYEVKLANGVREGLKIFKENSFNLVIVANNTVWKKFLGMIRQLNPEVKIMMTTTRVDNDFCTEVLKSKTKIDAFLDKGKVVESLGDKLEKIFGTEFKLNFN